MIGEELGSYRVVEPIGKGGMASVYLGEHSVLGHKVAIKVLHEANPGNPMAERRFINEAKVIAAIRHPGIVELFDFGRGPDGRAYIVMELLDGETLRSRMRQHGPLPLSKSLVFARQIATAVAMAHDKGIIHRDLKPDNIFLVPDAEVEFGERVKVLDFGVAKRLGGDRPVSEATATGVLVGTPAYMSPEQCRGTSEIDHRSDIYSLGIVFYRMVTGQLPFDSAGTGELIGKHIFEEAPDVHDIDPTIPGPIASLIKKCLAKAPEDRHQDMHEVATELRRIRTKVLGKTPASSRMEIHPPVLASERTPSGKGNTEDEEDTHPTTLRAATGQASPQRVASRRTWPIAIGGALGLAVFVALAIASSGKEVKVPERSMGTPPPGVERNEVTEGVAETDNDEPPTVDTDVAPGAEKTKRPKDSATRSKTAAVPDAGASEMDAGAAVVGGAEVDGGAARTAPAGAEGKVAKAKADGPPVTATATNKKTTTTKTASATHTPTKNRTQPKRPKPRGTTKKPPPDKTRDPAKNPKRIPVPTLY